MQTNTIKMSEDKLLPMFQQNKTFTTEFRGVRYDYYLTGSIGDAEDYLDLCNILRSATSQDEVVIRINSGGGQVHTGNMIINAINESEANVIGFIESMCGSMATFIFLACDTWGVSDAAEFFCHTVSYGSWGKENENFAQVDFFRKQYNGLLRKRYNSFLSDEQIENVIKGEDIWLNADEIMERLETYAAARDEKGCGNPDCKECGVTEEEDFDSMPTLQEIVAEAVKDGIAAYEKSRLAAEKKSSKSKAVKVAMNKEINAALEMIDEIKKNTE